MAGNIGFKTYVVADACATHDRKSHDGATIPAKTMHEAGLASLHGEFATVCDTDEMLAVVSGQAVAANR
jgi:nicotinamidase-related amidase